MVLYQIKNLNGESGRNGGYKEFEFCKEGMGIPYGGNISVTFGHEDIDYERHNYSVRKFEVNIIGDF